MGDFRGFPAWGVRFYADLERDNTREFWTANKARWEADVRAPMRALLDELEPEFGQARLFRPHRDIRFSADKSPTRPTRSPRRTPPGRRLLRADQPRRAHRGRRLPHALPAQTEQFRDAVADDATGQEVEPIVAGLASAGFALEGATLKTRPRGYPADHPRIDLLRRKELMAIQRLGTPSWLETPEAVDQVRAAWRQVRPLTDWVTAHVDSARPGTVGRL